jgi:hypothetical protein
VGLPGAGFAQPAFFFGEGVAECRAAVAVTAGLPCWDAAVLPPPLLLTLLLLFVAGATSSRLDSATASRSSRSGAASALLQGEAGPGLPAHGGGAAGKGQWCRRLRSAQASLQAQLAACQVGCCLAIPAMPGPSAGCWWRNYCKPGGRQAATAAAAHRPRAAAATGAAPPPAQSPPRLAAAFWDWQRGCGAPRSPERSSQTRRGYLVAFQGTGRQCH